MSGRLIVFEGTDGSGKATQSKLLFERLQREGVDCRKLDFPRYGEKSAALVELYLGGAFGSHPNDVNAYAASTFYSVDRYASYKQDWGKYYEAGGLLIADRYTTSNAVHQASNCRTARGRSISTGFSILSTGFWAFPSRRSSFISTCPLSSPRR